jgi:hypothetical protein
VARLVARLAKLGYQVNLQPSEAALSTETTVEAAVVANLESLSPLPSGQLKRRRGRPCKCLERGIICKHGTSDGLKLLTPQTVPAERFS